jgi:AcrR family transcriptional regulator
MRAIARALGYSPAALYEYFPAKEDIFGALYFEGAGGLAGRMVASGEAMPPGSSIHATLHEMGRAYRRYAHEQPELFGLVFGGKSMHGQSPSDDDDERPGFDELVRAIERGIAAGEIDSPVAEPVAVACWSIVHGFVVLEMAGYFGPGETRVTADPEPDDTLEPSHYSGQQPTPDGLFELVLDRMLLGVVRRRG